MVWGLWTMPGLQGGRQRTHFTCPPIPVSLSFFGGLLREMTPCFLPDSLLIWVQRNRVRLPFPRKMSPLWAGAMGPSGNGARGTQS